MLENSKGVTNSLREASESVVASSWVTRYTELVEYKREFGNCCVPRRYKTNPKLGCWVSKQRQLFKSNQLAEHRIAELNEIGFTWEIDKEDAWMSCYNELVEYKREFGNCCVPQRYKTNPKLGSWVHNQRSLFKSNRLAKDHIEKLNEIGFTWGIDKEDAWKSRYNELVEYKKAFGDCCVPRRYKANPQLANWLQNEKDSALDQANKYSQHIKELGQALDPTQQDLDSKHEELTVAYSKLEALEEQLHNEVTMLHNRVSTLESQLNDKEHELAGVQDKKAAIAKECEKCTSESEELAIELERAEKKLKESELNAQQTEAVLKEQLNSLTSSLEAAGKEKKKNDQLMEELAGENEELLKELNSTKRDLDCAHDEVTDLGKQVEQLKANLSEECQARQQFEQQKCDRASKVNSELEQRLRESIDECANLQNQIDSLKKIVEAEVVEVLE
jgi:DNA repair exonuclease SbcCD ATPase subunit